MEELRKKNLEKIREGVLAGDKRSTARLITMAENGEEEAIEIVKSLYYKGGQGYIIGITGPPGAGKSTLTDKIAKSFREQGKSVGIIAIDPTSPFTGGAILGDRVRMSDLNMDPGVFIRSMGARGHLGGISSSTGIAIDILDIYGCDYIIVETVGVGQSEVDIVKNCDTTVLVMVPGLGDDIQAIKAGVMEIGDIFVVNKADREGSEKTAREIKMILDHSISDGRWLPEVQLAVANEGKGIDEIMELISRHEKYMVESNHGLEKKVSNIKNRLFTLIKEKLEKKVLEKTYDGKILKEMSEKIINKEIDPYFASEKIINVIYREEK